MWQLIGREVSQRFGNVTVLESVDITIEQGQAVALLAPSGSGKTTLLAILGGLLHPTSGSAVAVGPNARMSTPRSRCSWVLQTTTALARRTTVDNVALGALALGASVYEAQRRAAELLTGLCLADRLGLQARHLSGGELQRLNVARALCSAQPFILADEPTGQLDRATGRQVVAAMFDAVRNEGAGLVIATHDPDVAALCDRRIRIVNCGLVEDQ